MVDTGMCPDDATDHRILEIEVRGKRGVHFCESMPRECPCFSASGSAITAGPLGAFFGSYGVSYLVRSSMS